MNVNIPSGRYNKRPLISVIMSIYSEPLEWLRLSIDSILKQTYDLFEFIIVCDNPNYEDGINLLKEYSERDSRIRVLYNPNNIGLTKSLNKALSVAKGQLIARMDADDIAYPERFEEQIKELAGRSICICHSGRTIINSEGKELGQDVKALPIDYSMLFLGNIIAHPSVMMTSDVLKLRTNLYDEKVKKGQDYELWTFCFLNNVSFAYIPSKLINYRESDSQISKKNVDEQWKNSQSIRSHFVREYLRQNSIDINQNCFSQTRKEIKRKLLSADGLLKASLEKILFLIDYNLVMANRLWSFLYIIDCKSFRTISFVHNKMFWQAAIKKQIYPFWILKPNE